MPFAKSERLAFGDDCGERCQRAALAQRSREMPRVVLASNRPAEREHSPRKFGKSFFQVSIDPPAERFQRFAAQRFARCNQPRAFGAAPAFERVTLHAILY
jgi:urease accessory protein UreF